MQLPDPTAELTAKTELVREKYIRKHRRGKTTLFGTTPAYTQYFNIDAKRVHMSGTKHVSKFI